MATLIQSKQIEGIVTASVITGEFLVSGSLVVTGSNSILGSVTASAISSSFIGDGSGITGITYSQIENTPKFVGGNNITITSSSNVITVHAQLDGTGSDTQNLTIDGDQLTILGGNTITIPTGSNVSDYFELSNIPEGIVSSSIQILGGSGILSGSKTDISSLNTFSSSIQSEVDSLTAATSSYLTSSGSVDFSDVTNKPSGLVSSSDQIQITESQISDLTHYGDSDVKTKLDAEGVVSGSVIRELPSGLISGSEQLPSGLISGSSQITITQSQISDLAHTDVTNLNTFTSSIQSEVDSLTSATSSYITEIPQGTISGSEQLPSGLVSSSDQITITESQISDLLHYSDSDVQLYIDSLGVVSGSVVEELPSGVISGSEQLPSGLVSSSGQITITESQISDLTHYDDSDVKKKLDLDGVVSGSVLRTFDGTGVISGSIVEQLPSGVISGSSQVTISSSQISDLVHTQIPIGTISGSEQLPSGLVSSSAQITITESQISDLTHTDISQLNQFTSSIQSEVDSLTSSTASYLTSIDSGIISSSTQVTELLPSGIISGSSQLLDGSGLISSSEQLPNGLISGSEQLPSGVISGSSQITITESQISDLSHVDITLLNQFSSSIESRVDVISSSTSSYLTELPNGIVSGSVQIASLLPNGVVSGSEQLPSGIISGSTQIVENLPSGVISGSSQITITESQISDLSHVDISSLNSFTSSIERRVSGLSASTSSYLTSSGSVDYSDITNLPSLISGSGQITDASNLVSSSNQIQQLLPSGVISGSTYSELSSSVFDNTELLGEVSGANYLESQSVDGRLDAIEGNLGFYYDLSNTVWNNKYIKSGSGQVSDTPEYITGNQPFKLRLNDDKKLHYSTGSVVYIQNFDRDIRITALVSSSYETGSREIGFTVLQVNGETGSIRINDSYWILTRHTQGFVDSGSYIEASASFDSRIDLIVASGSGADWDINLWGIPQGIVSSSNQQYTASIENGFALTSSLDSVSASLATTIQNVYQSSSNFDGRTLVSGSSQIDFREVTNYVSDEHIDHTTVNINAGDGLDGGGDISDTREIRLNVTSSHFTVGVSDVLVDEGVVKQSTLDDDIINTDFSQSIDTRLNQIVAGEFSDGIITGSGQINITQTQGYTEFSSSIATSIENISGGTSDFTQLTNIPIGLVSGSTQITDGSGIVSGSVLRTFDGTGVLSGSKTDISHLNEFTTSIQSQVDELILSSSTFITSETDSQTLTIVGDQLTISDGNTITIPTGSSDGVSSWNELTDIPSGLVSGSYVESLPSGLVSSSEQVLGGSGILSGSHTDITSLNDYTSSTDSRLSQIEAQTGSYLTSETDNQTLTIVGDQLTISDGNTITIPTGSGESIDTGSFATTGSNTFVGDQNISGSLIPPPSGSGTYDLGSQTNPWTDLYVSTGSVKFVKENRVISSVSGEENAIRVGNILITTSSIDVVNNFGQTVRQLVKSNKNSESDVDAELLLPNDLLSGSILPGTNITIDSSSGDYVISSTASGGGDTSFNGDRAVTNTLLGDLFTESFNAGTSGSIQEFLDAVFFPSYAPTATFSTQTSNLNTNLTADGTVVETISVSDTVDDSPYVVTLTGEDAFRVVPTNADSSSWEIQSIARLSAGTFTYDINVTDTNGASRTYSGRTLEIQQANSGTLSTTGTFYIIESATTGPIYLGSNGRGGSQGGVSVSYSPNYGSQSATNFQSSNSLISINSSTGVLSVGDPISGSGNVSGDTITSTISWEDQYGNTDSDTISVNVTQNNAPDITFTNSSRLNTNQAVDGGGTLVTISFNDTESDSINYDSFVFTDTSGQLTATKSGGNYLVTANSDLSGSTTYSISATIEDVHGFRSNTESHSFTITQGSNGTLVGDTTMYIIESAVINDNFKDATGFGNGNIADVNVIYSPSAGSQVVQSFNSTNPAILIDSVGNMSLGVNLSGSVTQSGDTIQTLITFQDQYGNIGSGSVTANIFGNNSPSVTFTATSDYDTDGATVGSNAGTITISDTETNSPYNVVLGGTDGGKFNAVPQNSISSSWQVQPTGSLSSNTYSIDITVTDNYGESSILSNKSIVVDEASAGGTVYVYTLPIDGTYVNVTGITSNGSGTPPEPTFATTYGLFTSVVDSDTLGDSTITVEYGGAQTATLRGSASGNNVDDVLSTIGGVNIGGSPASERIFVFIPSGSEMSGVPTSLSTADAGGGSTSGEYIVYVSPDGTFQGTSSGLDNDIKSANIHKLTLDTAVDGFTDWYVIGTEDKFNNSNAYVRMVPSSGSIPS